MKRNRRKIFVLLMIFCLTFTMMPSMAFAAEEADPDAAVVNEQEEKAEASSASEQAVNAENADAASVDDETASEPDKAAEPEKPAEEAAPAGQESKEKDQKQKKPEAKEEKVDSEEDFDWLTYDAVDPSTVPKGFRLMGAGSAGSHNYTSGRNSAGGMQFNVTLNGKAFHGLCCEPAVKAVSEGTAEVKELLQNSLTRKIAYKYRDWYNDDTKVYSGTFVGGLTRSQLLEAMFQYANHKTAAVNQWKENGWGDTNGGKTRQCIIDEVERIRDLTADEMNIPSNFTAYKLEIDNTTSGSTKLGQDGVVWGYPVDGKVKVRKKVTERARELYAEDPVKYSVKGAKFRLYTDSACSKKAKNVYKNDAVLTIKEDGIDVTSGELTMEVGTYWMKEITKPSSGAYDYERDENGKVKKHKVVVEKDKTTTVTFIDDAKTSYTGYLVLQKDSENPTATNGNNMYSLEDAEYQVYTTAACAESDKAKDTSDDNALFETDADGTTDAIEFELGEDANSSLNVWVKEVTPSKGYMLDSRVYGPYTITRAHTAAAPLKVSVKEPIAGAANLTLVKEGDTLTKPAELAGAEFEIEYHAVPSEDDITPRTMVRKWKFATAVKGSGASAYAGIDLQSDDRISGDSFYIDSESKRVWPLGTYKITETKAPTGYVKDTTPHYVTVSQSSPGGTASFSNPSIKVINIEEPRLHIKKVNAAGAALSGATLQIFDGNAAVGSSWVSNGSDHEVTGLTAGKTYTLRELAAPAGYDLAADQTFTAPSSGSVTVTMTNVPVTVGTTAKSGTTNTKTGVRKSNETIVDTIHMTGLTVGRSYKIEGKLMNKRTGAEVPNVTVSPVTFTATAATMDKEMTFTFDSRKLADNDSVVVYETLYRTSAVNASESVPSAGKEIASHRDINDAGQTVTYPPVPVKIKKVNTATGAVLQGAKLQIVQGSVVAAEWTTDATEWHEVKNLEPGNYVLREISAPYGFEIANDIPFTFDGISSKSLTMSNTPVTVSTTAVSKATGKHIGPRKASEVITDTVHMTGLIKDREYRLTGQLMNKRTGQAVPNAVVSPKTFKATAATMDVAMDITFDSAALADGDSVVVYETLHRMTKVHTETVPVELGKHQNINDAAQTVIYPGISTVALDQSSQTHNLLAGPNATIVDTVTYKGLLPGVAYTLEGELFDKTTNRLTGIKGTATIPANAPANGTAKMTFTFDASGMENHTLVVYETLKLDSVTLTEHKNPNDTAQTIWLPEVKTTLIDNKTRNHLSNAAKSVTVTDTVVCNNLIVGRTYTISGKLVFQDNGNDVLDNGKTVTAETTFEAKATSETKALTFTFDGSALEGKTVVAFEDLYTNNKKVGMHADLKDEGQSDHIPKVRTTALDSETKDHISLGDESITIHDTVSFENLIPGKTYTVTGKLMDKATGNEIPNVTTQPVEFKPDKANGTVVVDFVFNGKNWQNHKAVAFEKLYLGAKDQVKDNNLIGVHENLNDVEQTVHIPEIKTTLKDTKSTDHIAFGEQTVTLKDTIEYKNLIKGKEYVATGRLMNKRTGEAVKVNGTEVVSEPVKFTAPDENGSVVVTFTFNGVSLPGETVVAFEKLTYKGVPVAVHENINDAAQTVHLPKIRTVAAISDDNHVFTDTINYENLLPDRKYVFRGWLVDTATGTKIAGSDGKVDLTATAANVNGSVKMEMNTAEYDNMYGHSMTAYEELYVIENINGKDTEIKVAEHKDRSGDASTNPQTIEIYHDLKVQKNVTGNLGDLTKIFEYTVAFTDLVPNTEYKVEGDDAKTFKAGADGKATLELKLADDQEVVIKQLPKSATYVVTEAASDHIAQYKMFSEDMAKKGAKIVTKEANNGAEAAKILATAKETVDLFDGTIVVLWENNRDIATLTGVQTYLGIWAAALALVLAGIVTILARRRKYSAE